MTATTKTQSVASILPKIKELGAYELNTLIDAYRSNQPINAGTRKEYKVRYFCNDQGQLGKNTKDALELLKTDPEFVAANPQLAARWQAEGPRSLNDIAETTFRNLLKELAGKHYKLHCKAWQAYYQGDRETHISYWEGFTIGNFERRVMKKMEVAGDAPTPAEIGMTETHYLVIPFATKNELMSFLAKWGADLGTRISAALGRRQAA